MRRLLLLILCLSSMWTAQGQVAYDWRYWFDQSPTYEQGSSEGTLHLDVDVSGLSKTLHQIHIQVRDTAGVFSEPVSKYFVVPDDGHGSSKLHYWFNQNNADLHVVDLGDGMFDLNVSHLSSGFHTLYFIATDKYGATSEPMHRGFIRATDGRALKWRYWFDDALDKSVVMPPTTTSLMIDVDSLSDGIHYIHLQAMNETFSEAKTQMFIKVPKTVDLDEMYCLVLIDNMLHSKETINMKNGGMATLNLDVKDLSQGLHKLDVMVMTPSGALSTAYNSYFIRGYLGDDRGALRCMYAFDDESDVHETTYSEGMSHLNIDVAHLTDGPHTVRWMLADKEGAYVSDKRSWFIKIPLGGNAVSKYCYWLNDADNVKHVTVLEEPKNSYDLIALLPVETMPLRSSSFHFENKDNQPMMYAKNDIHFTFTDRFDRETNISKQYVDYNTFAAITDFAQLKPTQTFTRPDENRIKWFRFEAAPGDTIAFRSSQATSLQVFAPSGKEILSTMGDKSMKYTGAHTWEEGTYYVAVHDVTGSKPSVTLDYMHMDKYDVVSQDVHVVGNGGCSTITFQGNGFRDLYAVDLKDSKGNIIESIDVGHESDATTTVTFDFTGAKLGKYNAVFHFTEEDKTFANNITVEEAKDIELATKVSYPSTFLRGTSVTYTVEITNKGNMTAYGVPVYTYIKSMNPNDISYIKYDGMGLKNIFDNVDIKSIVNDQYADLLEKGKAIGDAPYFISLKTLDEETMDSVFVRFNYFFTVIPPNETKTFDLTILSSSEVDVIITTPEDWMAYSDSTSYKQDKKVKSMYIAKSSAKEGYCCVVDRINCFFNLVSTGCDIMSPILLVLAPLTEGATAAASLEVAVAGCLASYTNDAVESFSQTFCTSDGNPMMNFMKGVKSAMQPTLSAGTVISCLGATLSGAGSIAKGKLANALSDIADLFAGGALLNDAGNGTFDCVKNRMRKPYCPPTPPQGGSSTPVNSYDPNDIYGYIAPSGSMCVGEDVVNLPYRIEFENDTTFATSAAHSVVVKDTLDAKVFDLSSYQPTSIKIGDKSVQLKGDKTFVTTFDMRPEINAIAQVEGIYDEKKGIATWQFTSLDPMTMEPTDDIMQGFLPVNYDGSGIGEVAYNINRKAGLSDGTAISNKASIVFDSNDAIETPVWTNIIDAIPPVTHVSDVEQVNDTIVRVHFDGEDNRSGVWKYALYVQYGENTAWNEVAELDTTCCDFRFYKDIDYGFCVVATDSAGNVEKKIIQREYKFLNGEGEMIDGISSPKADQVATNRAYDLSGRLIQEEGYRGITIKNRKKWLKRQ